MNIMDKTPAKITLHIDGLTWAQVREMIEDRYGALMWDHTSTAYPADDVVVRMAFAEPAGEVAQRAVGKAAPQQTTPATTTAVRAACGKIIQTLAEIVNAPQTDAHFDAEVVPRSPLMNRVQDIKAQVDAIYKLHPVNRAAPQQEVQEPRPVTPYTCPKCHALWLHWPAEQSGFGMDTLNCRSADHCHYCEKGGVEQLERLERVPAVLKAPQPAPSGDAARALFDAGWKACARFCDREDAIFDGIVGSTGCPEFEAAFNAARKEGK